MPTPWVQLLLNVEAVFDDADADLDDNDRAIFYVHVLANATQRREHPDVVHGHHPQPGPADPDYRDPTGD
jgi:hypothetical protein